MSRPKASVIMGIDPGTLVTGYGVINTGDGGGFVALDFGCIRPPASLKLSDRYLIIFECMEELLDKHKPDALVVETQFVNKNPQSAIKLGMARGTVLLAARRKGVAIFEYAPTKAKQAVVGNGRASKIQVQAMTQIVLGLKCMPEPSDAADALALAICHAHAAPKNLSWGVEI